MTVSFGCAEAGITVIFGIVRILLPNSSLPRRRRVTHSARPIHGAFKPLQSNDAENQEQEA